MTNNLASRHNMKQGCELPVGGIEPEQAVSGFFAVAFNVTHPQNNEIINKNDRNLPIFTVFCGFYTVLLPLFKFQSESS